MYALRVLTHPFPSACLLRNAPRDATGWWAAEDALVGHGAFAVSDAQSESSAGAVGGRCFRVCEIVVLRMTPATGRSK